VVVLTSSVEFHGVNLDRPQHGLQFLSWELGGLDLADVCLQPVTAIDGGAANELDEAKVQDWKVFTVALIRSEIISQLDQGCSRGTHKPHGRWPCHIRRISQQSAGVVW
jgi:hypothetical protein